MATIEKRGENQYRITVSCGYNVSNKQERKRKTITLPDGLTEKQKEKELSRIATIFEEEVKSGRFLDGEKVTLAEFCNTWLEIYAKKHLAPGTLKNYCLRLEKRIIPALGHIRLAKLQPNHLMEFYNNLNEDKVRMDLYYKPSAEFVQAIKNVRTKKIHEIIGIDQKTYANMKKGGRTRLEVAQKLCDYFKIDFKKGFYVEDTERKLSSKTIKHHHDLISSVLSTAVEWNLISSNPAQRVKPPKVLKREVGYYDDKQVIKLLTEIESEPIKYRAIIYLTIDTGLRLGEAAGLKWEDLNLETGVLNISRQRQYVSNCGIIEKKPKTESGNRRITVSDTVLGILKEYKKIQSTNKLRAGTTWIESNNIFVHDDGKPIFPNRPYQWFTSFLKKHNLPKITFHELRHTNASLMIARGADIVTVSGRLGHADKNVTLNTYSHIIKSKEKQVANAMDGFYSQMGLEDSSNSYQ